MEDRQNSAYVNYKQYGLRFDLSNNSFSCFYGSRGCVVKNAGVEGVYKHGKKLFDLGDYRSSSFRIEQEMDASKLAIHFENGPEALSELTLIFGLSSAGIQLRMDTRGDIDYHFNGSLQWGKDMEHDTFAVNLNRDGQDLRCALGPAASTVDNALFDRNDDAALEFFGAAPVLLHYDWLEKTYKFALSTVGNDIIRGFGIRVQTRVYEGRFNIPYCAINKQNTFPTPPAGWMTWYAVQFDANENTVLENARWQAKNLKDFGANTIWVDWEWFHSDMSGVGYPDTDSFHPDPRRYPNGLKHVADEIKKLGLIPALWVGFTNDPTENEQIKNNPDILLIRKPTWCGQYFLDASNPKYLKEYIPAVFRQVLDWGYEALKWDCLPNTLGYLDQCHDNMFDPEITSEMALRQAISEARKVVGPDFYMLSCSGRTSRDITMAVDIFDAARIGGDIFQWSEFITQCVQRAMKFYALHNVVIYDDPDNVILREKFNSFDQARSRLSFVSLLGLPLTLGDSLPQLPEDRIELLRRGLPAVDAHPMDIRENVHNSRIVKVNLAIERPFERWNVVDVLNLLVEDVDISLDLYTDLHLQEGKYLVYDYWKDAFLGEFDTAISLRLGPCASRVLCVRSKLDRPQILSTSRHITQGAVDIRSMDWNEKTGTLSVTSDVIAKDPYTVTLHVPENLRPFNEGNQSYSPEYKSVGACLWRFTLKPKQTGSLSWSVAFMCKHPV